MGEFIYAQGTLSSLTDFFFSPAPAILVDGLVIGAEHSLNTVISGIATELKDGKFGDTNSKIPALSTTVPYIIYMLGYQKYRYFLRIDCLDTFDIRNLSKISTNYYNTIRSVLSQVDNGQEKNIVYLSRTLTKAEQLCYKEGVTGGCKISKTLPQVSVWPEVCTEDRSFRLTLLVEFQRSRRTSGSLDSTTPGIRFSIQHDRGTNHQNANGLSRRSCTPECKQRQR